MMTLFLIVLVDLIGFGLYIPLLPFYAEHFGASPFIVGLSMATFSFAQFISAPLWGHLSDRKGRRPILMIGMAGSVISYLWLGFTDSLWMIFAARALNGLMAGNISAAFAYMADVTTRENRAKGMGLVGAAFGLGFIVGPAIGGILAGSDPANADFQAPAFAAAGLSAVAFIMTISFLKESLPADARERLSALPRKKPITQLRESLAHPTMGRLLVLIFLSTFVFAGLETTFAMWSRRSFGWGPEQNGYLFAFVGITSAVVQGGLVGRLANKFGERALVLQGAMALAIGVLLIPFADNLPVLLIAMMIAGYGFSIITPSLNSLVSLQASENEQGSVLGVTRSASTLARVAGPAWAGMLFSVLGRDWPYFGGAMVMVIVIVLAWKVRPHVRVSKASAGNP